MNKLIQKQRVLPFCFFIIYLIVTGCEQPNGGSLITGSQNGSETGLAVPDFSVPPGEYQTDQQVKLTTTEPGASIYYTDNGDDPLTEGNLYVPGTSIPVGRGETRTIKAYTALPGGAVSKVVSAAYKVTGTVRIIINQEDVFTDDNNNSRVYIALDPAQARIHYTMDGSVPTREHGFLYVYNPEGDRNLYALNAPNPKTLRFLAYLEGWKDATMDGVDFSSTPTVPIPVFLLTDENDVIHEFSEGAIYDYKMDVQIRCPRNPEAHIRYLKDEYTTDPALLGEISETTGTLHSSTISLTGPYLLKARAFFNGDSGDTPWEPSEHQTALFNVRLPAPQFSPAHENAFYSDPISVYINYPDELWDHVNIYYSTTREITDFDDPADLTPYSRDVPLPISRTTTFSARAYPKVDDIGWHVSEVSGARYQYKVEEPTLNVPDGTTLFYEPHRIEIYSGSSEEEIYYTINDSTEAGVISESEWRRYVNPFILNGNNPAYTANSEGVVRLKIISCLKDENTGEIIKRSPVVERTFTFQLNPPIGAPDDDATAFNEFSFLLTTSPTSPADTQVLYTLDGLSPAEHGSGAVNSVEVTVTTDDARFRAIARKENWKDSDTVNRNYTLKTAKPDLLKKHGGGGFEFFALIQKDSETNSVTYNMEQEIKFLSDTDDAAITYTLKYTKSDGEEVSITEEVANKSTRRIDRTYEVTAWAQKPGWAQSDPEVVTIELQVPAPVFNRADDTPGIVEVICNRPDGIPLDGVSIMYRKNGSNNWNKTSPGPIVLTGNTFLEVYAIKEGWTRSIPENGQFDVQAGVPSFEVLMTTAMDREAETGATETHGPGITLTPYFCTLARDPADQGNELKVQIECPTEGSIYLFYTMQDDPDPNNWVDPRDIESDAERPVYTEALSVTKPDTVIGVYARGQNEGDYVPSDTVWAKIVFKVMKPTLVEYNNQSKRLFIQGTAGSTVRCRIIGSYSYWETIVLDSNGTANFQVRSTISNGQFTFQLFGERAGWQSTDGDLYTIKQTEAPEIGDYDGEQRQVEITGAPGCTISYRINSGGYIHRQADAITGKIVVTVGANAAFRITAYATLAGEVPSGTTFVDVSQAQRPTLGQYNYADGTIPVTDCDSGATVYYTITQNGVTQPVSSIEVNNSGNGTITGLPQDAGFIIRVYAGMAGGVNSAARNKTVNQTADPVIQPLTQHTGLTGDLLPAPVTITTIAGARIYYTVTNAGDTPVDPALSSTGIPLGTTKSYTDDGRPELSAGAIVRAIAVKDDMVISGVDERSFNQCAEPAFVVLHDDAGTSLEPADDRYYLDITKQAVETAFADLDGNDSYETSFTANQIDLGDTLPDEVYGVKVVRSGYIPMTVSVNLSTCPILPY